MESAAIDTCSTGHVTATAADDADGADANARVFALAKMLIARIGFVASEPQRLR
jgi:hypothetical protein